MCDLGRVSSLSLPRSEEDERGYHHWGEEGKSGVGEEEKARKARGRPTLTPMMPRKKRGQIVERHILRQYQSEKNPKESFVIKMR